MSLVTSTPRPFAANELVNQLSSKESQRKFVEESPEFLASILRINLY